MGYVRLFLLLLLSVPIWGDASVESLRLKAGHVSYSPTRDQLLASSDVELRLGELLIRSEEMTINTTEGWLRAEGGVWIDRGGQSAYANSIYLDIPHSIATLKGVRATSYPKDVAGAVYLRADTLIDYPTHKHGDHGIITTCILDEPHYYFKASNFDYYPEHKIVGKRVLLYYPIGAIPFGIYSPIYSFELGKRRIIWNFPVIGQKQAPGWGWFMQNTIDYDYQNGHESSVLVDWYQFKGLGLGLNHYYQFGDHDGRFYYYHFTDQTTHQLNQSLALNHSFSISDDWTLSGGYRMSDSERISSTGRVHTEGSSLRATYLDQGRFFDVGVDHTENFLQKFKTVKWESTRRVNQDTPYALTYSQHDNLIIKTRTLDSRLTLHKKLPTAGDIKTAFTYQGRQGIEGNPAVLDDQLQVTSVLTHPISPRWLLSVSIDDLFDLDGNRVTGDMRNFFYKLPEFKLAYTQPNFYGFSVRSSVIAARYQEQYVVGNTLVAFPSSDDFELQPNTYIFDYFSTRDWHPFSPKNTFTLASQAEQYLFKTPGFSLEESDSLYRLTLMPSFTYNASSFMFLKTDYQRTYLPEQGHSPFISQFKTGYTNINRLNQSVILYYGSQDRYRWSHTVGFDYVRDRYTPYSTSVLIKPNSTVKVQLSTGADINRFRDYLRTHTEEAVEFETAGIFKALVWDIDITPSKNMSFSAHHSQNINEGRMINSYFTVKLPLGPNPDYRWSFETDFIYDTPPHSRTYDLSNYQMETIKIVKQDHCRKFTFSYTKRLDEYRLIFTILAFPNDTFGFVKNPTVTKFEGFFDKSIQERL